MKQCWGCQLGLFQEVANLLVKEESPPDVRVLGSLDSASSGLVTLKSSFKLLSVQFLASQKDPLS
jgi:hypothetical protein